MSTIAKCARKPTAAVPGQCAAQAVAAIVYFAVCWFTMHVIRMAFTMQPFI